MIKLAKWCDAVTKAWHKLEIEGQLVSMSHPYLMFGSFHLHLQLKPENDAGDVFPAGHFLPASQWGPHLAHNSVAPRAKHMFMLLA